MKLNKKIQYALLLVLYLTRAGRSPLRAISLNLKLNDSFLVQVANQLRKKGLLKSYKGPGGGFELSYELTVGDVIDAVEPVALISHKDMNSYVLGDSEHRTLAYFVSGLQATLINKYDKKIKDLERENTAKEVKMLNQFTMGMTN